MLVALWRSEYPVGQGMCPSRMRARTGREIALERPAENGQKKSFRDTLRNSKVRNRGGAHEGFS